MNYHSFSFRKSFQALLVLFLALANFSSTGYAAPNAAPNAAPSAARRAAPNPSLKVIAPATVAVGDRIELQLVIDNAQDIAGYEAQLLFDTTAAHFSGLHQRDSDLKKFGRDVIPLEATELPNGTAMGLASCMFSDCVHMDGPAQLKGANGRVRLASVLIGTDQQGALELRLANTRFVDAQGNPVDVDIPAPGVTVQVGAVNGVTFTAPANGWRLAGTPATPGSPDLTGDGQVGYADAIEAASEWQTSREKGSPCGPNIDLSRDVNGDGCIDVGDIQLILGDRPASDPAAGGSALPRTGALPADGQAELAAQLTFTVDSDGDQGDTNVGNGVCETASGCTLRAAIQEANNHAGPDTITFNIPGSGVHTIQLESTLPTLADSSGGTTIDGYTQPGAMPNTDSWASNAVIKIQIRGKGSQEFRLLLVQSAGNRIQGLSFFNGRRSIWLYGSGATGNVVVGNFIGTDAAGSYVSSSVEYVDAGVMIEAGAAHNQIGGPSVAERNVISGNSGHGINFHSEGSDYNEVMNNLIGLNPAGTGRLMNLGHGVDMNSGPSYNVVGGATAERRNIISGNGLLHDDTWVSGLEISHDMLTRFNQVIGNCFGTDTSCNNAPSWASNLHFSIRMEDGPNNNTIAGNVVVNGLRGGIRIGGVGTEHNAVYDNRIGVTLDNTAVTNDYFGISITNPSKSNRIGPNNIIANSPDGIRMMGDGTDQNTVTRNSIYNNDDMGIELGATLGVTPNDTNDYDYGPNQELNFPVLTSATTALASGTACTGSNVPKPCTIEVFVAERNSSDSGGGKYGQGKTFAGSGTTDPTGAFTVQITGVSIGQYLTATATDAAGNTSEFSLNIQVTGGPGGGDTFSLLYLPAVFR